ncbi:hypothetical protein K5X77_06085 [Vagococcus lutrae]|uniref:plasmid mobilization protein n=1 Tax=Vagococcus lutrae TaxID=81947 RepID=UPI001C93DDC4|nr:hypothetical protein [Vagococcus lutrae]QZN88055.1 hypothetical protein K5X77_06085 [Vagococcus lutrae]
MKRTESIQVRLSDGGRLHVRVSPEEKEMIRHKAEAENMTMSALVRRSLEKVDKPITVNLDKSDLRDLVIQARRIDSTVRTFLKNMDFNDPDSIKIKKEIEQNLIEIEEAVLEEVKKVERTVAELENLSTEEVMELAENIEKGNNEK